MFSTKAEYGVRVMAHLARNDGDDPISLGTIADAEGLPLAYLEHLVQRLRKAGLVESRRGAHGGYTLAREADEITMAEIVRADRVHHRGRGRRSHVLARAPREPRALSHQASVDPGTGVHRENPQ
jgi:Rrf2 family protein